jgi:hypothetical protein
MRPASFFARSALLATATAVTLAACGGKTSTSSPSSSSAASDLETALCDNLAKCDPIALQVTYGDVGTCIRVSEQAQSTFYGIVSDAEVEACAQAVASAGCGDVGIQSAACDFHGTVPVGGACGTTQLCAPGAKCSFTSSSCGTCVPAAAAGQPCHGADCAEGLTCTGAGGTQCVPPVNAGGACTGTGTPCAANYLCLGGVCSAPLEGGASCAPNPDACDEGNGVSCVNGTCVAPSLAKVGEPCGDVGGVLTQCIGLDVACVPTGDAGASTCIAPLAAGSPCNDSSGAMCVFPTVCLNGTCSEQPEDAGACP